MKIWKKEMLCLELENCGENDLIKNVLGALNME